MRQTWQLGVGLSLLLVSGLRADPVQYTATVTVTEAEVRSGAGNVAQIYPTNLLRKGDTVEVIREMDGGWLAIKPPRGSYSWINTRFVKQVSPGRPSWVVVAHPDAKVPVLLGSAILDRKPTVEGAKVKRGTLLRSIDGKVMVMADDGYWLPVEPPPSEVRYIKAEAVSRKPGAPGPAAEGPPGLPAPPGQFTPPAAPPGSPAPTPPASPEQGSNALLLRAQQAEQAGRIAEAVQLYRQLGTEVANTNHSLSVQAYNRAQWLADRAPPKGTEARYPIAATTSRQPPAGNQPVTLPAGWTSSGPGVLRRAGRCIDYSTMYVLENSQGLPILYATAQQGYSLETYLNRNIELLGVRQFRNDLRAYHMTVMQVQPLR